MGGPHLLHVLHSLNAPGGTQRLAERHAELLEPHFRSTLLYPRLGSGKVISREISNGGVRKIGFARSVFSSPLNTLRYSASLSDKEVETEFMRLLAEEDFSAVHFFHLLGWGSLNLVELAKDAGKKVVVTLTDLFLLCPDWKMLGPQGAPCGKPRAREDDPGCGDCLSSKMTSLGKPPEAFHLAPYLAARNATVEKLLEQADEVVALSPFLKRRLAVLDKEDRVRVIEPGVDVGWMAAEPRELHEVAFVGHYLPEKGSLVFEAARKLLPGVTFRIVAPPFANADLPRLLQGVDLAVLPSIWEETYNILLAETQALGIPALASAIGAHADRVREGENGFLFEAGNPRALADKIEFLRAHPESLRRVRTNLRAQVPRTFQAYADDYRDLYEGLLRE